MSSSKNRSRSAIVKHIKRLSTAIEERAYRKFWDEVQNFRTYWVSEASPNNAESTSLTDEGGFLGAVAEILSDLDKLKTFRSNESIRKTYDHVSHEQGLAALLSVRGRGRENLLSEVSELSSFGKPAKYHYPRLGRFSPTVLRYAKFALDIEFFFPEIGELSTCEIGVGFGGQAITLNKFFGTSNFVFFDLPEVNKLANACVQVLTPNLDVKLCDGRRPSKYSSDLVISNFAFSEMARSVQDSYLKNVLLQSPRGFMAFNSLSEEKLGGLSLQELQEKLPPSIVVPEEPASNAKNVLLVWGSKRAKG